jgi:galactose mutarotase-like enzyme
VDRVHRGGQGLTSDPAPRAFVLRSDAGLEATILDWGATLARLRAPDRDGRLATPRFGAVALETQHLPNAPNEPRFPSARLDPGTTYDHETVYELGLG